MDLYDPSCSSDNFEKRPKFGSRYLNESSEVFDFNAWDDVVWDVEQEKIAKEKISENSSEKVPLELANNYRNNADEFWEKFYSTHETKFFKDRKWLFTEFPEILEGPRDNSKRNILEVGCGVGNSVFPIINELKNRNRKDTTVFCCDFSQEAINLLENNSLFDSEICRPFVFDISKLRGKCTSNDTFVQNAFPIRENSLDLILLIFCLHAIDPALHPQTIRNLCKYLKPGGKILFRDYGKFDMTQLRFKSGRCLDDNQYVRGDGTLTYFFEQDEVDKLFIENGNLIKDENIIDRRLLVNRLRQLKMYRVWIQAKYRRPE